LTGITGNYGQIGSIMEKVAGTTFTYARLAGTTFTYVYFGRDYFYLCLFWQEQRKTMSILAGTTKSYSMQTTCQRSAHFSGKITEFSVYVWHGVCFVANNMPKISTFFWENHGIFCICLAWRLLRSKQHAKDQHIFLGKSRNFLYMFGMAFAS
jgi:hypothetical protein